MTFFYVKTNVRLLHLQQAFDRRLNRLTVVSKGIVVDIHFEHQYDSRQAKSNQHLTD